MKPRETVLRTELLYVPTSLALPTALCKAVPWWGHHGGKSGFSFGITLWHQVEVRTQLSAWKKRGQIVSILCLKIKLRKLLTRLFQEDPGALLPGVTTSGRHKIAKSQDFSLLQVSMLYAKLHAHISFSSGRKFSKIIAIKQQICSLLSQISPC